MKTLEGTQNLKTSHDGRHIFENKYKNKNRSGN